MAGGSECPLADRQLGRRAQDGGEERLSRLVCRYLVPCTSFVSRSDFCFHFSFGCQVPYGDGK